MKRNCPKNGCVRKSFLDQKSQKSFLIQKSCGPKWTLSFSILHSFSISNVNKTIFCLNIIVIMPISYKTNDNWDSFSDSAKTKAANK
jgi:hypothetical protein